MLCVAVMDDDIVFCTQFEKMLQRYGEANEIKITADIYFSGAAMLQALKDGALYDILFLDIEMQQPNGVAVGRYIRETMQNEALQIVYVSGKTQYAMELFQVRPFWFLEKPTEDASLSACMTQYQDRFAGYHTYLYYTISKTEYRIALQDVLYLESKGRKILIHTRRELITFYGRLDLVCSRLAVEQMIRIHKSFAVNPQYVVSCYSNSLYLSDGTALSISRKYRKEVRSSLFAGDIMI